MNLEIKSQLNKVEKILLIVDRKLGIKYATWTKDKATIKFNKKMPGFPITSNYIYWCNLGVNIGSEQNKIRPVIVTKTKKESNVCTIIPLTSERMNDTRWYHIDLEAQNSTALIEQLRNVSKLRILNPLRAKGKLIKISLNDWKKINKTIVEYYSLTNLK